MLRSDILTSAGFDSPPMVERLAGGPGQLILPGGPPLSPLSLHHPPHRCSGRRFGIPRSSRRISLTASSSFDKHVTRTLKAYLLVCVQRASVVRPAEAL